MIPIREYLIVTACYRISGADLGVGQSPTQGHQSAYQPGQEEYGGGACLRSHHHRRAKDAHPDRKTHHDHSQVEEAQLLLAHKRMIYPESWFVVNSL